VLKRHNEASALGFVTSRVSEAVILIGCREPLPGARPVICA
jgi:hypothetical protein